jgi:shikimate dehydrogenase
LRARSYSSFAGVIGWPLSHTLSPAIHNAAFRSVGIDWVYLAWPVPPEALADAIAGFRALGAMGVNVTMPHKEAVIQYLDEISGDARDVGAVNTIQQIGGRLIGHNTDVDGFREFLASDAGVDVRDRSALVLGAGGAARAVVKALADLGAGEISIAARRSEQSENLVPLGPGVATSIAWDDLGARAAASDVIVNATPLGTSGADPLPELQFHPGQVIVDLVYDPPSTQLVDRARSQGAEAWGGIGMLVHQAAASFRIWTGQDPSLETMSAAALHAVLKR